MCWYILIDDIENRMMVQSIMHHSLIIMGVMRFI